MWCSYNTNDSNCRVGYLERALETDIGDLPLIIPKVRHHHLPIPRTTPSLLLVPGPGGNCWTISIRGGTTEYIIMPLHWVKTIFVVRRLRGVERFVYRTVPGSSPADQVCENSFWPLFRWPGWCPPHRHCVFMASCSAAAITSSPITSTGPALDSSNDGQHIANCKLCYIIFILKALQIRSSRFFVEVVRYSYSLVSTV